MNLLGEYMIKLIFKLIGLFFLVVIIFLALSLWKGGDPFRWFGNKSEQAGEILKEKSEDLGKEADKIKKRTDSMRDTTNKVTEGIRKTGDKVREFTGAKTDK
jgi:uncharacterized membrane protein